MSVARNSKHLFSLLTGLQVRWVSQLQAAGQAWGLLRGSLLWGSDATVACLKLCLDREHNGHSWGQLSHSQALPQGSGELYSA